MKEHRVKLWFQSQHWAGCTFALGMQIAYRECSLLYRINLWKIPIEKYFSYLNQSKLLLTSIIVSCCSFIFFCIVRTIFIRIFVSWVHQLPRVLQFTRQEREKKDGGNKKKQKCLRNTKHSWTQITCFEKYHSIFMNIWRILFGTMFKPCVNSETTI